MKNLEYIRRIGRTYFDQLQQAEYFYFTASGFEVTVKGSRVNATFKSAKYDIPDKRPYLVVMIDTDDPFAEGNQTFPIDALEKEIVITNLENKEHTLRFLKRTEAADSSVALISIDTDGQFIHKEKKADLKIQFIAASSSTGYGNLGDRFTPKSTENTDGLKGFAFLTAYMLNATADIFAASGWGVTRGWNTGGQISDKENIPSAYDFISVSDHNTISENLGKWNHTRFIPDVVVINLGTNDFNSCGYEKMSDAEKVKMEDLFITSYADFIYKLENLFPKAVLIVAYGLMGDSDKVAMPTAKAVIEANARIGSERASLFLMEAAGTNGNSFGSDGHPNVGTSINVAESLSKYISDLTGIKVVNKIRSRRL